MPPSEVRHQVQTCSASASTESWIISSKLRPGSRDSPAQRRIPAEQDEGLAWAYSV